MGASAADAESADGTFWVAIEVVVAYVVVSSIGRVVI